MDQIIGTITLPLFILFAFSVMLGIKPNVMTKPLLALVGAIAGAVLSIFGMAFTSLSGMGSTVSRPKPRFRARRRFND